MTDRAMKTYEQVVSMLEKSGFPYQMHTHPCVRTIEEAHERVPHLTRNLLKTVVFKIKQGEWVLAVVKGIGRVHYKKLADACGVKRTALRSISPEQVERDLGFQVGGVGPFPVEKNIRVVCDQGTMNLDHVFCGSGCNTATVEIKMAHLIALAGATVHPIVKNGNSGDVEER
jgi:Cys-tRNA(Pro)/Cys-tRNA(Cys) deacylase